MLRKTQSHPQSTIPSVKLKDKDKKEKESPQKHARCKSVPSPLSDLRKVSTDCSKKTSCPSSPTVKEGQSDRTSKSDVRKSASNAGSSSPKPKRNLFSGIKNTLRPKKSDNAKGAEVYANVHSTMPDVVQDSDGGMRGNSDVNRKSSASKQTSIESSTSDADQGAPSVSNHNNLK